MHLAWRPTPPSRVLARLRGEADPAPSGEASGKAAPKVAPSDVKVRVLNGTGAPGQAGDAATDLGAAGFGTAGLGDADTFGYARTEIRYGPGAQPKAALLGRYLGGVGKLVADSAIRGTDLVLVIGADWKGVTATARRCRSGGRPGLDDPDHRRSDDHHRQGVHPFLRPGAGRRPGPA